MTAVQVRHGRPEPEELAALVVALLGLAAAADEPAPPSRSRWQHHAGEGLPEAPRAWHGTSTGWRRSGRATPAPAVTALPTRLTG